MRRVAETDHPPACPSRLARPGHLPGQPTARGPAVRRTRPAVQAAGQDNPMALVLE